MIKLSTAEDIKHKQNSAKSSLCASAHIVLRAMISERVCRLAPLTSARQHHICTHFLCAPLRRTSLSMRHSPAHHHIAPHRMVRRNAHRFFRRICAWSRRRRRYRYLLQGGRIMDDLNEKYQQNNNGAASALAAAKYRKKNMWAARIKKQSAYIARITAAAWRHQRHAAALCLTLLAILRHAHCRAYLAARGSRSGASASSRQRQRRHAANRSGDKQRHHQAPRALRRHCASIVAPGACSALGFCAQSSCTRGAWRIGAQATCGAE